MAFNSLAYIVFLCIVCGIFAVLPRRGRQWLLLIASYMFYGAWDYRYTVLILLVTCVSWVGGRMLAKPGAGEVHRRLCLGLNITSILCVLLVFKYHVLVTETTNTLLSWTGQGGRFEPIEVLLPVGISFYTFQAIGYLVDVYRDRRVREPSLTHYALYIAFFPQLVAGPIERAQHILPQLRARLSLNLVNVRDGFVLILWGFFKKIVVADRLAVFVDAIYETPDASSPYQLLWAMYFFSFQIYCDFSGYTDIARGSAKFFGIDLMENFRQPYFSTSIQEFWRRWHISLSSWFRDYMYIPLGGSRVQLVRMYLNILLVFSVCGLWHGASWNFVVWGALHGMMLCLNHLMRAMPIPRSVDGVAGGVVRALKLLVVFHTVSLAWVFFRFKDFSQALSVLGKIMTLPVSGLPSVWGETLLSTLRAFILQALPAQGFSAYEFILSIFFTALLLQVEWFIRKTDILVCYDRLGVALKGGLLCVLFYVIIVFGWFGITEFIYFQF